MRVLGNLARLVVPRVRIQRRDEHETAVQELFHAGAVHFNAVRAAFGKRSGGVAQDLRRVQHVGRHDGFEDVQFKVALRTADRDGRVVAHDLRADHGDGLALRRVDLAGHDAAARFVGGQGQFAESAPRSAAQKANVVGNLVETAGRHVEYAGHFHERIVRRQRFKLVGRRHKGQSGFLGNGRRNGHVVALDRVQTGPHRGPTQRQAVDTGQHRLDALHGVLHLLHVAGKFLSHGQGRGILTVRATDFDDSVKLVAFLLQRLLEFGQSGDGGHRQALRHGNVHGRGKGVVAGLSHIDVIVGMDGLFGADGGVSLHDLTGAIRQHFVDIHIGLRARAGLKDHEGKVPIQSPRHHFVGGLRNGVSDLCIHLTGADIVERTALFDRGHGLDNRQGHFAFGAANGKVLQGALRLGSVECARRDVELTHGIAFGASGQVSGDIAVVRSDDEDVVKVDMMMLGFVVKIPLRALTDDARDDDKSRREQVSIKEGRGNHSLIPTVSMRSPIE